MFSFARATSARAQEGSALGLLVVVAHVEHTLMLSGRNTRLADKHMASAETRAEIAAAERRWADGPGGPSPVGRSEAHNLLAYAWWLAEEPAAAQRHLAHTREHLSEWPWGYSGDPTEAHARAQVWGRTHASSKAAAAA